MPDDRLGNLLFAPSDVARALRVDVATVHQLIAYGALLAIDVRRWHGTDKPVYRVSRASLEAYQSQARMGADGAA